MKGLQSVKHDECVGKVSFTNPYLFAGWQVFGLIRQQYGGSAWALLSALAVFADCPAPQPADGLSGFAVGGVFQNTARFFRCAAGLPA